VVFHAADSANAPEILPSSRVGADGSFTLSSYVSGDGAPAGQYLVTVDWLGTKEEANPKTGVLPNKLPSRYSDPKTSTLHAEVREGTNELPAFQLHK
jgi:hypothetical protein